MQKSQDRIGVAAHWNLGLRIKCLDLNPYSASSKLCHPRQLFDPSVLVPCLDMGCPYRMAVTAGRDQMPI